MSQSIPGPSGSLLLGNLPEFRRGMLPFFDRCRADYGPVASFRLGPRRLVLLSEPSLIEEVLVKQNKAFRKHFAVRLLRPVLGDGLLLSEGQFWLRQRRLIQPSFSRRFHDDLHEVVRRQCRGMAAEWRRAPQRDLYRDMTSLTVRIAAEAFLGVDRPGDVAEVGEHLETIHSDFEHRFQQAVALPRWLPTSRNRRLRRAVGGLTAIIDRMIEDRRDAAERHDALSLLLRARDDQGLAMPRQQLRDEVMTLLLAGHDTTANGLTWTWVLLSQHPEVAEQLRHAVAAAHGQQPDAAEAIAASNRLARQIFQESMRLYPPVYLFGREALRPVELGGRRVARGDSVVMSQWVVHRDSRFFPDPLQFQPQRWTGDFEKSLPKFAYFPFGGGPRVCLGKEAAMVEAATVLTELAPAFQVTLDDPHSVTPWPTVTLRPRNAVHAQVVAVP